MIAETYLDIVISSCPIPDWTLPPKIRDKTNCSEQLVLSRILGGDSAAARRGGQGWVPSQKNEGSWWIARGWSAYSSSWLEE